MSKEAETTNVARAFRMRWTVGRKLGALVAVLLGLLMIGSVHSLVRMGEVGEEVHEIASVDLPLLNLVSTVEVRQLEQHVVFERALRAAGTDQAAFARELARFDEESRQIGDAITAALALAGNNDARSALARQEYASVKERLETLRTEHDEFEAHAHELFRRLESGQDVAGAADAITKVEREAEALDSFIRPLEEELRGFTQRGAALAEEHEQSAFSLTLLLAAVALILGVSVSIWLVRRITRTVQAVTEGAERLARGELNADPVDVSTTDELGKLATVFNGMVTNLAGQVRDTRIALETLTAAGNEILAATKQQAATTKEQAATIQEITASMEEIGQSGSQISERAGDVAQRAESSSTASSSGRDAMRETNRDMESIREQIEEVAENIVALSEKTQAVGEIIAAVNEIAEQSNLLALNAAIEAAAAGEQGSRFSVVANEIKNLADQAKDSTGQVRKILGEIQKGINAAVMLTEEAVKRAEQGKQKASTTEMTIEELLSSTQDSIEAFQQIVAGSNQQQIGITQVTQGMQDIRQAAEQNAVGTSQLERAVSDLTSLGRQLEGVVAQYSL